MRVGSFSIDPVIDGENQRPLAFLYPTAPQEELEASTGFVDRVSGNLVMSIGSQLIRMGDRIVLVDAGVGTAPLPPFLGGALRSALLAKGISTDQVTDVLFTHLHLDHIGWATQDGLPMFPNATYHCDRRDWDYFTADDYPMPDWEKRTSHPETDAARVRLGPIADRMSFWEGDDEILPGIESLDAPGHTPGSTAITIESDGERVALLGDIVHSKPELVYGWEFSIHVNPALAVESVLKMREWLSAEGIPCSAAHFPGLDWGRVERQGDAYRWTQLR